LVVVEHIGFGIARKHGCRPVYIRIYVCREKALKPKIKINKLILCDL
jgi:hypothetical protein